MVAKNHGPEVTNHVICRRGLRALLMADLDLLVQELEISGMELCPFFGRLPLTRTAAY